MNILICSVGRRVNLVEYFREELYRINGKVIAIDCDPTAPALYHANQFEIVPRIDHPDYVSHIKSLCKKYKIRAILSLIDPELPILSSFKEEFAKDGIQVIVSGPQVIEICFDKYLTHKFLLQHELPSVKTYCDIEDVYQDLNEGNLKFPLIAKPKRGSGSIGVQEISNHLELEFCWRENENIIIQPFIDGTEACVECYIDLLTNETVNLFSKRKINMRAGETDKSIAVKDPLLNSLTLSLIQALKPVGPIDIDLFKTKEGYVISEINPRFGGGYPYAYQMGENFIKGIINNLNGIPNQPYQPYLGEYQEGKVMARYDQFVIL